MTNKNEQKKVPELRFPEFSGEWERKQLGQLVKITSGVSPNNYKKGGNTPLFKVNDLNNNIKYQEKSELNVHQLGKVIEKDSIIFPKRGAAILTNKVRILKIPGYMDSNLMALKFEDNEEFFYQLLLKEGLYKIADTSTIPQINNKHIIPYKITIPLKNEQQKIGEFFSKLDRQIELEEKKLALLEEQKKGYMQKIFSQELRFKDENGEEYPEWEKTRLDEICKLTMGFTPSTKNEEFWNGDLPWLSIAGMNSKYTSKSNKFISEKASINKEIVKKGTLIMSFKLSIGNLTILKEDMYTNEAICHFNWKNNCVLNEYIYYYLQTVDIKSYGSRAAKGITLNSDNLNSILMEIPEIKEQNKIANILSKLDEMIDRQSIKISNFNKRKAELLRLLLI